MKYVCIDLYTYEVFMHGSMHTYGMYAYNCAQMRGACMHRPMHK